MWMLDLPTLRTAVVSGLNAYLGVLVVVAEQARKRPSYPFLTLNISGPFNPEGMHHTVTASKVASQDPGFEFDVEYTAEAQVTLSLSINAYSKSFDECHELAIKAHSWFSFVGHQVLKDSGLVVVSVGSVGERDSLIITDYERRNGFDVTLRAVHQMMRTVETIESIDITEE